MVGFPAYNRDVMVGSITRFYEVLVHMGYIEKAEIQYPPPSGWNDSQIDAKSLRLIGRNETAIELLQHLPYLKQEYDILPDTKPVTYLNHEWPVDLAAIVASCRAEGFMVHPSLFPFLPFDMEIEPSMVVLTHGRDGVRWLIDTAQGCIYPCESCWTAEKREGNVPWLWYLPVSIEKYFDDLRDLFVGLKYIALTAVVHRRKDGGVDGLEHEIFGRAQEEVVGIPTIFQEHGWPLNFQREECRNAVTEVRLKILARRDIRWAEEEIKYTANSKDEIAKERAVWQLNRAQGRYAREWE